MLSDATGKSSLIVKGVGTIGLTDASNARLGQVGDGSGLRKGDILTNSNGRDVVGNGAKDLHLVATGDLISTDSEHELGLDVVGRCAVGAGGPLMDVVAVLSNRAASDLGVGDVLLDVGGLLAGESSHGTEGVGGETERVALLVATVRGGGETPTDVVVVVQLGRSFFIELNTEVDLDAMNDVFEEDVAVLRPTKRLLVAGVVDGRIEDGVDDKVDRNVKRNAHAKLLVKTTSTVNLNAGTELEVLMARGKRRSRNGATSSRTAGTTAVTTAATV